MPPPGRWWTTCGPAFVRGTHDLGILNFVKHTVEFAVGVGLGVRNLCLLLLPGGQGARRGVQRGAPVPALCVKKIQRCHVRRLSLQQLLYK